MGADPGWIDLPRGTYTHWQPRFSQARFLRSRPNASVQKRASFDTLEDYMVNNTPFPLESDKPRIRTSVTVFLDVLGYRELMAGTGTTAEANNLLERLHGAMKRAESWVSGAVSGRREIQHWVSRSFTDNIVVGYPIRDKSALGEAEIGTMLWHVAMFQLEMIRAGFFVRGAISVGELYIDDHMVFGKALIEAYHAEQNIARVPRVVLARSAEELVKTHCCWYDPPNHAPQNRALIRDPDDVAYIDYLDQTILLAEDEMGPAFSELSEHRDRVSERLAKFQHAPLIRPKYEWAARYHNHFCAAHSYSSEYLIDPKYLDYAPRPFIG